MFNFIFNIQFNLKVTRTVSMFSNLIPILQLQQWWRYPWFYIWNDLWIYAADLWKKCLFSGYKNDNIFRIDTQLEVLKMDTIVNQAWHLSLFQFSLIANFFILIFLNFLNFSKPYLRIIKFFIEFLSSKNLKGTSCL